MKWNCTACLDVLKRWNHACGKFSFSLIMDFASGKEKEKEMKNKQN